MPTQLPKLVNRTNGAVTDTDANKWVAAFVREQQIEGWAVTHDQPDLLATGCLGPRESTGLVFGSELQIMKTATATGRRVDGQSPKALSIAVVAVSTDVNTNIQGIEGVPSTFGLVVEYQGPGGIDYVDANGVRTPASVIKPTDHFWLFLGGQYNDPGIGVVWSQNSAINCATVWLRSTCGV